MRAAPADGTRPRSCSGSLVTVLARCQSHPAHAPASCSKLWEACTECGGVVSGMQGVQPVASASAMPGPPRLAAVGAPPAAPACATHRLPRPAWALVAAAAPAPQGRRLGSACQWSQRTVNKHATRAAQWSPTPHEAGQAGRRRQSRSRSWLRGAVTHPAHVWQGQRQQACVSSQPAANRSRTRVVVVEAGGPAQPYESPLYRPDTHLNALIVVLPACHWSGVRAHRSRSLLAARRIGEAIRRSAACTLFRWPLLEEKARSSISPSWPQASGRRWSAARVSRPCTRRDELFESPRPPLRHYTSWLSTAPRGTVCRRRHHPVCCTRVVSGLSSLASIP